MNTNIQQVSIEEKLFLFTFLKEQKVPLEISFLQPATEHHLLHADYRNKYASFCRSPKNQPQTLLCVESIDVNTTEICFRHIQKNGRGYKMYTSGHYQSGVTLTIPVGFIASVKMLSNAVEH